MHGADNGAVVLGTGELLAFYGNFSDSRLLPIRREPIHNGCYVVTCDALH